MLRPAVLIATLALLLYCPSGNAQDDPLSIFDPLVNATWTAEGKWGDGSAFKQEIYFEYYLSGRIVTANSNGFINSERTSFGKRNYGIRRYDSISGSIKFWEFDVFGGLTTGEVIPNGKNILYQYDYGNAKVTDMWEYVNDSTYNFIVGSFKDGQWEHRFLETEFTRKTPEISLEHYGKKLEGRWSSKAWDGQLKEEWTLDENKQLLQHAEYIENGIVQYKASSKIERVDKELIIFSVIHGNNPKIFKASSESDSSITFENTEYGYPNKLIYHFNADGSYHRTISGIENGEKKAYTFRFKKLDPSEPHLEGN